MTKPKEAIMLAAGKAIIVGESVDSPIVKRSPAGAWRKYRIAPELETLGMGLIRTLPGQVVIGLADSSPKPRGKFKHFWVMRLRQLPGRNRLPRGFSKKPLFV